MDWSGFWIGVVDYGAGPVFKVSRPSHFQAMTMARVLLEDVSVSFPDQATAPYSIKEALIGLVAGQRSVREDNQPGLKNINLDLKVGDRLGIVGRNGAGKSTLLKTVCKIYPPTSGKIETSGLIAPLLEIGAGFHPEYTGRENIALNAAIMRYDGKVDGDFVNDILDFAGLKDSADTPVKYYSTGMFLRLGFSIATAVQPSILIMDEMFSGGDAEFVARASSRLNSIIDSSQIMMLVSHDLGIIADLCNKAIWLEDGRLKSFGSVADILEQYEASFS